MCWTEVTWNTPNNRWNVERPAGPDYRCDIFENEVQTAGQVGPIDGQPPQTPRTPAPSTEDKEEGSDHSDNTIESEAPGNTTEEERLAELAESIHINPPAMATMTEPAREETTYLQQEIMNEINTQTGHRMEHATDTINDAAALRRAQEPDRPDPPSGGPERLPELPPIRLPQDDRPTRGFPGGGFPGGRGFPGGEVPRGGGGYPGGGPPGAGPPGGGWGPAPVQLPQPQAGKLVGETPSIYDSERKNTQLFINQWELYWGVNNDNPLMINPYRRAMFFLTYIKGNHINEWVVAVNRWLTRQLQGGIATTDERLWSEVVASFQRCFADSLAKEKVQTLLREGLKMKGEDIDSYVAEFEEAVRMAEYRFDVPQTIETFTEGLPMGLYQKILKLDRPHTYEQWKQVAIDRQQTYMHMKARLRAHQGGTPKQQQPWGWAPTQPLANPNAMDTSAGRTRGRIAGSEEIDPRTMCGGYIPQRGYNPRGGFLQGRGRGPPNRPRRDLNEVECYTCRQKGHFSRNCPQHSWNKNRSQGREAVVDDWSVIEEEIVKA